MVKVMAQVILVPLVLSCAYTVFTDASLRDMCARLPRTEAEFLEVSGVVNAKLQRYGHEFLAAIGEFSAEG